MPIIHSQSHGKYNATIMSMRTNDHFKEFFREIAESKDMNINSLLLFILSDYFKREGYETKKNITV